MKQLYVKYGGDRPSVILNGANANPYRFFPRQWVEIHKDDEQYFIKRCERNAAWEFKIEEVVPTQMKYFARFMGIGAKRKKEEKSASITLFDRDTRGNTIPDSIRKYIFPMEKWIEINEMDKPFFKRKADANEHWEYEKRTVPILEKPVVEPIVAPKAITEATK